MSAGGGTRDEGSISLKAKALVASLLLVEMPGAPSRYLFLEKWVLCQLLARGTSVSFVVSIVVQSVASVVD